MKVKNWIYPLILLGTLLIFISSCEKKESTPQIKIVYDSIIDIDNNVYHTVIIGTQSWMVENLKTTKYCDGTAIPNVTDSTAWSALTTGAWCYYNNDIINNTVYGKLYNWYAVTTALLCPTGWHIPTDTEWILLSDYLGGVDVAGGKLKETGITHWKTPNTSATNSTGFTALPGGYRNGNGSFDLNGEAGYWYTATEDITYGAWYIYMGFEFASMGKFSWTKREGYSVRCLKD